MKRRLQSRFKRASPRFRASMFFEPGTLAALSVFLLTWAGSVALLLHVSGKWTHLADWVVRSVPS
jgi:hypothetical protein